MAIHMWARIHELKMIDTQKMENETEVQFLKPMGFNDYNALQMKSLQFFG
jgi:UDP-N-acetylglucosamine 2-epimerase